MVYSFRNNFFFIYSGQSIYGYDFGALLANNEVIDGR